MRLALWQVYGIGAWWWVCGYITARQREGR
jgi:hypothetical protein